MEVFVNPIKEVFEEVDYVVGTQEAIWVAYKYYNVIAGVFLKGV